MIELKGGDIERNMVCFIYGVLNGFILDSEFVSTRKFGILKKYRFSWSWSINFEYIGLEVSEGAGCLKIVPHFEIWCFRSKLSKPENTVFIIAN